MFGNQRPREKTIKEQSDGAQTTGMYCVIVQKKGRIEYKHTKRPTNAERKWLSK